MPNHLTIFMLSLMTVLPLGTQPERDHLRRGLDQYRQGEYGDAEVSFRRALALQPRFAEAAANLGNSLFQQRRFTEAERFYRRALPGLSVSARPGIWQNLGNCLLKRNRLSEAAEAYRNVLRLRPGYAPAQRNLSYILQKLTEKSQKKPVIRNITQTQRQLTQSSEKQDEKNNQKPDANKPDQNAETSQSRSTDRIQSQINALSGSDMETMLRQLDAAEKQIRGRPTRAKGEKKVRTEEKDW